MLIAEALFVIFGFNLVFASPPVLNISKNPPNATCPGHEGWLDASSADMGCVLFDVSPYTWDAANNRCQTLGGTLVEIENEKQLEFLQFQLQFMEGLQGTRWWWTSGTDAGMNGVWRWATSFSPVGDFVWSWPFPDQDGDTWPGYNCLVLAPQFYYKGMNYDCLGPDGNEFPICQRK